jgi:signal peptidase II
MQNAFLKYAVMILILLAGCNSDYHTKKWAENNLKDKPAIALINNFVNLGYAENRGMVFGAFNSRKPRLMNTALIIIRILILCILSACIITFRKRPIFFLLPFMFFWIGATGNLIDVFKYGYVVDFIHIHAGNFLNWPFYFNLADAYIVTGVFLFIIKDVPLLRQMRNPLKG